MEKEGPVRLSRPLIDYGALFEVERLTAHFGNQGSSFRPNSITDLSCSSAAASRI
ncbi:MAG: hypothetical protein QGG23_05070 [Candidatus Bathyarchaeota archaeon]|nr:hypothetical protein [Candidatus Bathyarchaeota archaeon]MDP7207421.1 hypothetical protein [Candidatus Bathyarchaeota archaeon]MDP7443379.1 hypothetical protein [Candidatus Bathyarchaeota archaeon]